MKQFHLLLALIATTCFAQKCKELNTPKLCGTESVVVSRDTCDSAEIPFPEMPPCCRRHAEKEEECDDPDAPQKCRSLEISPAMCSGYANASCCALPTLNMKLHFKFEYANETCCSTCRCYGDPHCESFNGKPDTWVICDARTPKQSNKANCPMARTTCEQQLDHTGQPCHWIQKPNEKDWSIALQGSPCRFTDTPVPPQMSMYKGEGFDILLNMGERAIIVDAIIKDGKNQYVLNAQMCNDYAFVDRSAFPWRTDFGPNGQLPSDPDWLPKKWDWAPVDGKDVVWQITGLESQLDIAIRCTRTPEMVAGKVRYGQPRLNVDVTESKLPAQRPGAAGFCVEDRITKLGSTSQTDMIVETDSCTAVESDLAAAQILCNPAVTKPGVQECKMGWCKDHLPSTNNGLDAQTECVNDITTYGWNTVFCTLTLNQKQLGPEITPAQCKDNSKCRECLNDIKDEGLKSAVIKYDQNFDASGPCETTRSDLPPDFVGVCQKGVKVQYYSSFLGTWVTKFAIPSGVCIKNGYLDITQQTDPELFGNPIRIIQCSEPEGACLTNKCSSEVGFQAEIEMEVTENEYANVYNLFQAGELVCNPNNWNTPTECLPFVPEPMCPCPP